MHVARRALGTGAIELRDDCPAATADVDVERFEQAAADARRSDAPARTAPRSLSTRGELLPENRYDDWAVERRERARGLAAELARGARDARCCRAGVCALPGRGELVRRA